MAQKSKKTNNQDGKKKALNLALSQIEKQFGKGAIMRMGEGRSLDVAVIPTGIYSLDEALGAGGLPRGRAMEIYGPEGSGKTTLTLSIIAEAQKNDGVAAFIDAEHSFDPKYAKLIGVKLDDLLISQPDTGEQALDIVEALVRSNAVDMIVVDSVAALVPKAEIEGQMGDSQIALQARLMSQAMRKLTAVVSKSKTCVVFINQIREKVGVMFGSPEVTPGGRALKFYSSVRIDLRKRATLTTSEGVVGMRVRAKIVKNKVAPPFREAMFEIMYDEGVSKTGALIDAAMEKGILKQSGSWFSWKDENIAQGKENLRKVLKENNQLKEKLEKELTKEVVSKEAEGKEG
ncbi:MAG: recombinase RecA [Candidatus Omnitrophica bacterium]|nr:recombinase RecA [Candidatus Omnitrophota bacterium]MCF7878421.1 recombinase RecA [Candidatus Omnitrophota bacterium]MCF7892934.1 recombinase RecA [Candidatus Omnitrophota bacterium]